MKSYGVQLSRLGILLIAVIQASGQQSGVNGKGLAEIRAKAENGDPESQVALGRAYTRAELGLATNYVEAAKWYRKAAEQNYAQAQYKVGQAYENGSGVAKDYGEALKWYRMAAAQNNAQAQYRMGLCYASGQGAAKNEVEAVKWYRAAAEQTNAQAEYALGRCYAKGEGVAQDYVVAVKWFRQSAEQTNALAQYSMGTCYTHGKGVERDAVEAAKWYRKAADQNFAEAQFSIGSCYLKGDGVSKDEFEAVKWLGKAAEAGLIPALNSLAWILATSEDPAIRDGAKAEVFAEKAVAATHRKNPAILDTLAACYAEAGQFDKAVSIEREAMTLPQIEAEKKGYGIRLKLFEAKMPYHSKN